MPSNITIKDIAKLSGFSKSTVSRVLNGDGFVKDETRKAILDVAEKHHYKKNALARGMVTGGVNLVMIIPGDISNYFYGAAVKEIQRALYDAGYLVMMCTSEYDAEKELSYLDMADNFRVAGVILLSAIESDELKAKLSAADYPVLLMNRYLQNFPTDAVVQDNFQCAYAATQHLIENGHRNILHIRGSRNASTTIERREGFLAAMKDNRIAVTEDMVTEGDFSWQFGYETAKRVFAEGKFSAAFIGNDMMTVGFVKGWQECGGKIPEDFSLVCFDTSPFIDQLAVKISTVGCSAGEIGRQTAKFFLEHTLRRLPPEKLVLEPVCSWNGSVKNTRTGKTDH